MSKPIEFSKFYKLLNEVKEGNKEKEQELEWILAEYEHAKESEGAFDELGQIFCHIGLMKLYDYAGVDELSFIGGLDKLVWDYLKRRMGEGLPEYLVRNMKSHANSHQLVEKISEKWKTPESEVSKNVDGLAKYVTEGIIEVIE